MKINVENVWREDENSSTFNIKLFHTLQNSLVLINIAIFHDAFEKLDYP